MYKFVQRSFKGGQFDRELMGRTDLTKYAEAATKLENFMIRRSGAIMKRPGTTLCCDLKNLLGSFAGSPLTVEKPRIFPIVFAKDEGYQLLMTGGKAFLFGKEGVRTVSGDYVRKIEPYDAEKEYCKSEEEKEGYKGDKPFSVGLKGYDTLQQALNHAYANDVIKVYGDEPVVTDSMTTPAVFSSDFKVTIDLNGHRLDSKSTTYLLNVNGTGESEVKLINSGKRTFIGTDGNEYRCEWRHTASRAYAAIYLTAGKGNFTLGEGGEVMQISTSNVAAIQAAGVNVVTIEGGRAMSRTGVVTLAATSSLQVMGGVITSTASTLLTTPNGSKVLINGGRFYSANGTLFSVVSSAANIVRGEFSENITLPAAAIKQEYEENAAGPRVVDLITWKGIHPKGEDDYTYDEGVVEEGTQEEESEEEHKEDLRPFYIRVPYKDEDLEDLNFTQCGDTLFFAHRKYPPRKIMFSTSKGLTTEELSFAHRKWKRPIIKSVVQGDNSTFGTGAFKTVYYMCTYVKDGIESEPSLAYGYSYKLPWGTGAVLKITCDKGDNETEPDYYNIYKKDTTEYGLIATIVSEGYITVNPTVSESGVIPMTVVNAQTPKTVNDYLNKRGGDLFLGVIQIQNSAGSRTPFSLACGGVGSGSRVQFDFGDMSGSIVTGLTLGLDAFMGQVGGQAVMDQFSGTCFRVILKTVNTSGTEKSFTKIVTAGNPYNMTVGANLIRNTGTTFANKLSEYKRVLDVDFGTEIAAAYPKAVSTASAAKDNFWTTTIAIEAFDSEANMNRSGLWWHEVAFRSTYGNNQVFEDDYISPSLTVTPPSYDTHFDEQGDYPAVVGIYKQRLCFAASEKEPFTFWMSQTGDLYNFDVHRSIRESDAITATLDATEFPKINHLVMGKDMMLFSEGSEWDVAPVTGNALSYKTVSAKKQSSIGSSAKVPPFMIGHELIFVEGTGRSIHAIIYNVVSEGYESQDLSVLSQDIVRRRPIVQIAYQQNPDSLLWCALKDGTLALLVYMKEHELVAWSHHTLGGGFKVKGVVSSKAISEYGSSDLELLVEKDGVYQLWSAKEAVAGDTAAEALVMDGIERVEEDPGDGRVVVMCGGKLYAGYPYSAELISIRPEPSPQESIQFEFKNAKSAEVRVIDASSFVVRAEAAPAKAPYETEAKIEVETFEDGGIKLKDADIKVPLSGVNGSDGRIHLRHDGYWPITILSVAVNYEIQVLSGSQG